MKRALVLIDYIHDFVDDDGTLTVGKPAQAIRGSIVRAMDALNTDDLLILANDNHNWSLPHPEKALFPPHALEGTIGAQSVVADEAKASKATELIIKKTRYSAFFNTALESILKSADIKKLYLAGVCTDICVLHTAIDAYNLGFDTSILTDCVASFDPTGHAFALNHFQKVLGFELADSIAL